MTTYIRDFHYPHFEYRKYPDCDNQGTIDGVFENISIRKLNKIGATILSIEKWEFILYLYKEEKQDYVQDGGTHSCALCQKYYGLNRDSNECINCPIYKNTEKKFCYDTPYHDYTHVDDDDKETHIKFAEEEVKYLKDLLEKLQKGE